jgi:glycine cleavage system H protein
MSVLLALLTAAVLILVGVLRSRKQPGKRAVEVIVRRYVHPGHGWARPTHDGYVVVGVDDFTQTLLGPVTGIKLPRLLRPVRQGASGLTLTAGTRVLPIVSPVSGWVVEKNEAVMRDPSVINRAPYGDGWLFKVKPRRLSAELHNLLTGKAVQDWQDLVRARLARVFHGTPALMYQDGGVAIPGLAGRCSEAEWNTIVTELYQGNPDSTEKES